MRWYVTHDGTIASGPHVSEQQARKAQMGVCEALAKHDRSVDNVRTTPEWRVVEDPEDAYQFHHVLDGRIPFLARRDDHYEVGTYDHDRRVIGECGVYDRYDRALADLAFRLSRIEPVDPATADDGWSPATTVPP